MKRVDGWHLEPAVQNSTVVGFVSWCEPTSVPQGSFCVVWHQRNSNGSFSMKGFADPDPNAAAKQLSLDFGDPHLFEKSGLAPESAPAAAPPKDMANGLAIDDPLQPIAEFLDPALMELVVQSGAQGAKYFSSKSVEYGMIDVAEGFSTLDAELDTAAAAVEVALVGDVSSLTLAAGVTGSGRTFCTDIINPATWVCGGATPSGMCNYTGSGSRVCVTKSFWGNTYTTTTTPITTSCSCPAPASLECPARPACGC